MLNQLTHLTTLFFCYFLVYLLLKGGHLRLVGYTSLFTLCTFSSQWPVRVMYSTEITAFELGPGNGDDAYRGEKICFDLSRPPFWKNEVGPRGRQSLNFCKRRRANGNEPGGGRAPRIIECPKSAGMGTELEKIFFATIIETCPPRQSVRLRFANLAWRCGTQS